jgi:hypothetical protein
MIYYKIRSKKNPAMFRKADGTWNKSGKVYDTLGKLRSCISSNMNSGYAGAREQVNNWEFIEYEVVEKSVKQLHEVVDPIKLFTLLAKQRNS